jgi:hypothetical protein
MPGQTAGRSADRRADHCAHGAAHRRADRHAGYRAAGGSNTFANGMVLGVAILDVVVVHCHVCLPSVRVFVDWTGESYWPTVRSLTTR